jgi:Family of unknown function (DUF6157)
MSKVHTTNCVNGFIAVADDCTATTGEVPPVKGDVKTVANLQFELVSNNPYTFTSDDVLFAVHAQRNDITTAELVEARIHFFSKGQPCFRTSALTKRYGWGVHSNADAKIALYACNSADYEQLLNDKTLTVVKAMKSKK